MVFTIFLAATLLLAVLSLLPLWRHEAWWVRSLDFPRLQLFLISLALLVFESVWLDLSKFSTWSLFAASFFCLAYHAWWILPYTRLYPVEVVSAADTDEKRMIRIMTANVLTPNRNAGALLEMVHANEPDILITLESDSWWQSKLDALETDYPFAIKCPLDNLYGMHVYSKLVLSDSRIEFLVKPDIPSIHTLVCLPSGHNVRAHFLHPSPPSPSESWESSKRDAELVIVARSVVETDAPTIVAGDLNDVAWSATTRLFRKISDLLDPRVGRGLFNTFHADYWFLRFPLDHIFHSDHFALSRIRRLDGFGSDHFPLLTELVFEAGHRFQQNGLAEDQDDVSWAMAKADDENVDKNDVPQPGKSE